jgi:hypothetical protein
VGTRCFAYPTQLEAVKIDKSFRSFHAHSRYASFSAGNEFVLATDPVAG